MIGQALQSSTRAPSAESGPNPASNEMGASVASITVLSMIICGSEVDLLCYAEKDARIIETAPLSRSCGTSKCAISFDYPAQVFRKQSSLYDRSSIDLRITSPIDLVTIGTNAEFSARYNGSVCIRELENDRRGPVSLIN